MSVSAVPDGALVVRRIAVTDRAVVIAVSGLLFLPSALFALALKPAPALCALAGCAAALAVISAPVANSRPGLLSEPIVWRTLLGCCALALSLLLLGGETHLFYATWDWLTRDAVLADLVAYGARVGYAIGGTDYILRAPLGLYMAPAAVGRVFGLFAAHLALLGQNTIILGSTFYLLVRMGQGWAHLLILVLFAGVSIVGVWINAAVGNVFDPPYWLTRGLDAWHQTFQYSGTLVQLFWVPNHALPGWWLATLLLLQVRRQVDVATIGVSVAGALIWSPLAIVPVIPWLLFCVARQPREILSDRRTWIGAATAAAFIPIAIYLLLASASIPGGSLLGKDGFFFNYVLFLGVQLMLVFAFLFTERACVPGHDRALLLLSGLVLVVLPLFHFGPSNDLVLRGSIVSLTVVSFEFGLVVMRLTQARSTLALLGWALVAISAPSAAVEIGRAVATPRYAVSDCGLIDATRSMGVSGLPTNYIAPVETVPAWLIDTSKATILASRGRQCWPDRAAPQLPFQ